MKNVFDKEDNSPNYFVNLQIYKKEYRTHQVVSITLIVKK